MMFIGILFSIAAIGLLCCLLFTFAVFALPAFAGAAAGLWAYQTGAGWTGGILVGLIAAALTLGMGQFLVARSNSTWLRLTIVAIFVAPASFAGYHAVHGIVKHTVPSDSWQIVFSVLGAIAVGIAAAARTTAVVSPARSRHGETPA